MTGEPGDAANSPVSGAAAAPRLRETALTWPFQQAHWFSSLWILLIGWFPLPFPMTISIGWLFDAAGRRARHQPQLLPQPRDLPRMFGYGFVFWIMTILYFVLPILVLGAVFSAEVALITEQFNEWLFTWSVNLLLWLTNLLIGTVADFRLPLYPEQSFLAFILHETEAYSAAFLAPFLYVCAGAPVFLAGSVRFIVTGKLRCYFQPFKNLALALRHLPQILWVLSLMLLMNLALTALMGAGIILWLTAGVWISAYLVGRLAEKVAARDIVAAKD